MADLPLAQTRGKKFRQQEIKLISTNSLTMSFAVDKGLAESQ